MSTTMRRLILAKQRPDTAADIAWRLASREAAEIAHSEMMQKFQALTPENAVAAVAYQSERLAYHTHRLARLGVTP